MPKRLVVHSLPQAQTFVWWDSLCTMVSKGILIFASAM